MTVPADPARIEELLVAAARDPETAAAPFLNALLDAVVVAPGVATTKDDGRTTMTFAPLVGTDGHQVLPFYTSEDRLRETLAAAPGFEERYVRLPCRDLWDATRGATLVLNPHSASGKEFLPREIARILDGPGTTGLVRLPEGAQVFIGRPATVPEGLEEAVTAFLRDRPAVEEARLGWRVDATAPDGAYLLVLIGPDPDDRAFVDALGSVVHPFAGAHPIDMQPVRRGERHLLTDVRPFYRRERRGLFGRRRG